MIFVFFFIIKLFLFLLNGFDDLWGLLLNLVVKVCILNVGYKYNLYVNLNFRKC